MIGQAIITWAPAALATSYKLYRDTAPDGSFVQLIYNGSSLSFNDSGLQPGTNYYYKVKSIGPGGESPLSSELAVYAPISNQPVLPDSMRQAIAPSAVGYEYRSALLDTQALEAEYGVAAIIHIRDEGNVTRDTYNSIMNRPTDLVTMVQNVATLTYQPTKYQMEKAGLREETDAMIYVAMQDFIDKGLAFDDLETKRMSVDILPSPGEANGTRYEVKEKARAGGLGNGFLYVTFGLRRG